MDKDTGRARYREKSCWDLKGREVMIGRGHEERYNVGDSATQMNNLSHQDENAYCNSRSTERSKEQSQETLGKTGRAVMNETQGMSKKQSENNNEERKPNNHQNNHNQHTPLNKNLTALTDYTLQSNHIGWLHGLETKARPAV